MYKQELAVTLLHHTMDRQHFFVFFPEPQEQGSFVTVLLFEVLCGIPKVVRLFPRLGDICMFDVVG